MATSQPFDNIGLTAAQVASTTDLERNLRSSYYVTDKQPSRVDSAKAKIKKICRSASKTVKKLFRGKKHGVLEMQPLPPPAQNAEALAALEGGRTVTMSTYHPPSICRPPSAPKGWSVHIGSSAPEATTPEDKTRSALWKHPVVNSVIEPPTPATTISGAVSTPGESSKWTFTDDTSSINAHGPLADGQEPLRPKKIYEETKKKKSESETSSMLRKEFKGNLDDHHPDEGTKATNFPPKKPTEFRPAKNPRVPSQAPAIAPVKPINPHISGFDGYKAEYTEGMYYRTRPNIFSIPEAAESSPVDGAQTNFDTQKLAVEDDAGVAAASQGESGSNSQGRRPEYTSLYCPRGDDGRVYSTAGKGFDKKFDPYGSSTCASSQVLPSGDGSNSTRPSTAATAETPGIPFTPAGKNNDWRNTRHSKFYGWIEQHGGLTPAMAPSYPVDSQRPVAVDSAVELGNIYTSPPTPPPPEVPPKVPVPPRKPVPKPSAAAATAGPSKPKANVNKPLPDSPGLNSPRCFTPAPTGSTSFPPRTDSLNNPASAINARPPRPQTVLLHPNDYPATPTPPPQDPYPMNANGYPIYNAENVRRFSAESAYHPRGHMNEIEKKERESKAKRAESVRKARAEAEAKRARKLARRMRREEVGARKLCHLQ